jgi:hypothetical protein
MDREFRRASELARESWLFRIGAGAVGAGARAWNGSRAVRVTRSSVRELSALGLALRLRLIGLLVLSAAITHAVLLLLVPPSLAPAAPLAVLLATAVLALLLATGSRQIAGSWQARWRRRRSN